MESRKRHYESKSEEEVDMSPETPLISGADPINKLPDEVLLKIFCYLSSKDIIMTISLVSERFHRLSQDSKLLTEILKVPFLPVHNGQKEFKCETCGKAFDFLDSLEDHIRQYGKHCDKSYDKSYIEAQKSYIKALKHAENLFSLILKDCYIHDTLCIALQNNKKLRHLEISNCNVYDEDAYMYNP